MLAFLGFSMVSCFMYLIMSKRLTALVALIIVPTLFAFLAGMHDGIGKMIFDGVKALAPTGVMITFSILYFGVMIDAGLFDPLVRFILKVVKGDPLKISVGAMILTMMVALDGDSSTTYMIACAAFYPLYKRVGMNLLGLTCIVNLASAVMNIIPWGGPTARAAAALHVDALDIFLPMIPAMIISGVTLFMIAVWIGRKERSALGILSLDNEDAQEFSSEQDVSKPGDSIRRPKMFWFNLALTIALVVCLISGVMPLQVLFMIAFAIAITFNYPRLEEQKERVAAHAGTVLAVTSVIFAAGVFTGILSGTGMVESMAKSLTSVIPEQFGPYMAVFTALISIPFTFFLSNDAFFFGMVPVLAQTASAYGFTAAEIGRAALIGQAVHLWSPLVPSVYLLVALAKVDLGDHQRTILKWSFLISFSLLIGAVLTGAFPFYADLKAS